MGYCLSDEDIPGLPAGVVEAEVRRWSFVLSDDLGGVLELNHGELPRLLALLKQVEVIARATGNLPEAAR